MPWLQGEDCCDRRYLYRDCCHHDNLSAVSHSDNDRLRARLQRARFALVGDSLTRQWFETLTCFLGLSVPAWFAVPPAGTFTPHVPMHVRPRGYTFDSGTEIAGYSVAGGPATLEYFHYDQGDSEIRDILRHCQPFDFVVINMGIHYPRGMDNTSQPPRAPKTPARERDLRAAVAECEASRVRCVFRETFPVHFDTPTGYYGKNLRKVCRPLRDPRAAFDEMNQPLHSIIGTQFPILPTFGPMASAWAEHKVKGDCAHYCSDAPGWSQVHLTLLRVPRLIGQTNQTYIYDRSLAAATPTATPTASTPTASRLEERDGHYLYGGGWREASTFARADG